MITCDQFIAITGNKNPDVWVPLLNKYLEKYEINTKLRVAAFVSQCTHESGGFNLLKENLNYSADGLRKTFGKYFPDQATANKYARQPKWIGSRVYAGRMGNGSEASGDGYKFCGRGLIQLTGKINYMNCSAFLFSDDRLMDIPELIEQPEGAVQSACWFWVANGLNLIADKGDVLKMTLKINGGKNGIDDRIRLYNKAIEVL